MPTTVERIRTALGRRDGISAEAMRPLAAAYGAEVERVNDRLSGAVALLHKGLRSEAIQSASMPPNAIDAAAALDFVEADEWMEILQLLEVPVPTTLDRDLADQLNEAIVEAQPLEGLMQQQRRMAIARAPLAWRLKLLRKVAERDSANGVWREDLEAWEKARIQQLAGEADEAVAEEDHDKLKRLRRELIESPWLVKPDDKIRKKIETKLRRLDDRQKLAKLKELAPALHDAYCQMDEATARGLRERWNASAAGLRVPIPDDLSEQADGPLQWLAQLDHDAEQRRLRAEALGRLEAALDRGAQLEVLEQAYHQVMLFDEPPPPELLQRYQVTVADRELAKRRRFQILVSGIAMTAVVTIVALGLWQWETVKAERAAAAAEELRGMVDSGALDSAEAFLAELQQDDPVTAATPRIESLESQLESLIEDEKSRAAEFQKYLSDADAEDPAEIDRVALGRAESSAVTEAEKAAAFAVRDRWSKWNNAVKSGQTEELNENLAEFRTRLDKIEESDASESAISTIDGMLPEIQELAGKFPKAESSTRFQVNALRNRAVSMRGAIKRQIDQDRMEATALVRLYEVTTLSDFGRSLERFTRESPRSSRSAEFQVALENRDVWDRATAWNDFLGAAIRAINEGMSEEALTRYETEKERLAENVGQTPVELPGSVTERFDRHVERIELLDRVLRDLPDTVVADLITIVETDEQRRRWFMYESYYEQNATLVEQLPQGRTVDIVVSGDGAVEGQRIQADVDVWQEPYATIRMLAGLSETKREAFLLDWEGEFLKLAADLRRRDQLDGRVKEMLLLHLLAGACEGSGWLSERLSSEMRMLKNRAETLPPWHDPLPFERSFAADVEQQIIPRLSEVYRDRPQVDDALERLDHARLSWVGFLDRDRGGDLTVHLSQSAEGDGTLAIPRRTSVDSDQADWIEIGSIRSSEPQLRSDAADLIAGTPVFFLPSATAP